MLEHIASAAATGMVLADLANPKACLPPGFSSPVSTALGWVKALGLVVAITGLTVIGALAAAERGRAMIARALADAPGDVALWRHVAVVQARGDERPR